MNRLFRLLPLASLVLTACAINAPKGRVKARILHSGVSTSKMSAILISSRRAALLLIFLMSKKSMPASSGSRRARTATACC